jgi:hypothetical protein
LYGGRGSKEEGRGEEREARLAGRHGVGSMEGKRHGREQSTAVEEEERSSERIRESWGAASGRAK